MKLFDMMTSEDIKRLDNSTIEELIERVKKLESSRTLDTMDEVAYRELQKENAKLKKRVEEAEGELTIIKGIGQNSPEMKALQKEVETLKADLSRAKEEHQYDNLVHQKELESLRKK